MDVNLVKESLKSCRSAPAFEPICTLIYEIRRMLERPALGIPPGMRNLAVAELGKPCTCGGKRECVPCEAAVFVCTVLEERDIADGLLAAAAFWTKVENLIRAAAQLADRMAEVGKTKVVVSIKDELPGEHQALVSRTKDLLVEAKLWRRS